jgi:hypothetical protein
MVYLEERPAPASGRRRETSITSKVLKALAQAGNLILERAMRGGGVSRHTQRRRLAPREIQKKERRAWDWCVGLAPPLRRLRMPRSVPHMQYQCLAFGRSVGKRARATEVLVPFWRSVEPGPRRALLLYCTTPFLDEWTPAANAAFWKADCCIFDQ